MGKLVDQGFFWLFPLMGKDCFGVESLNRMSGMVYNVRSHCQLGRGLGRLWGFPSPKAVERFGYAPCERTMRRK